jgi:hypothetical protein
MEALLKYLQGAGLNRCTTRKTVDSRSYLTARENFLFLTSLLLADTKATEIRSR